MVPSFPCFLWNSRSFLRGYVQETSLAVNRHLCSHLLKTKNTSSSSRYFLARAMGPATDHSTKQKKPVPIGISSTEMIMSIPYYGLASRERSCVLLNERNRIDHLLRHVAHGQNDLLHADFGQSTQLVENDGSRSEGYDLTLQIAEFNQGLRLRESEGAQTSSKTSDKNKSLHAY